MINPLTTTTSAPQSAPASQAAPFEPSAESSFASRLARRQRADSASSERAQAAPSQNVRTDAQELRKDAPAADQPAAEAPEPLDQDAGPSEPHSESPSPQAGDESAQEQSSAERQQAAPARDSAPGESTNPESRTDARPSVSHSQPQSEANPAAAAATTSQSQTGNTAPALQIASAQRTSPSDAPSAHTSIPQGASPPQSQPARPDGNPVPPNTADPIATKQPDNAPAIAPTPISPDRIAQKKKVADTPQITSTPNGRSVDVLSRTAGELKESIAPPPVPVDAPQTTAPVAPNLVEAEAPEGQTQPQSRAAAPAHAFNSTDAHGDASANHQSGAHLRDEQRAREQASAPAKHITAELEPKAQPRPADRPAETIALKPLQGIEFAAIKKPTLAQGANARDSAALSASDERLAQAGVTRGLSAVLRQKGGSLSLNLNPPSLGAVRINMTLDKGSVEVALHTTTTAGHQLLTENLAALRTSLESRGLTVEKINVTLAPSHTTPSAHSTSSSQQETGNQSRSDSQHNAGEGQSRGRSNDQGFSPDGGANQPDDFSGEFDFGASDQSPAQSFRLALNALA